MVADSDPRDSQNNIAKALEYLTEIENKTLLLRTGHASGIGMEQELAWKPST